MPYNIWWEVEGHILYASYSGEITSDELLRAMKQMVEEMRVHGGAFVNVISDVRNVSRQPSIPEVMTAIRQIEKSEQMGWTINVGESNAVVRFTTNIAGQYLGQRMRSFDTPEEAIAFLKESDPSIDWDLRRPN